MRLLVHREKKEVVDGVNRIVSKARTYAITDTSKDVHTLLGKISQKDLEKPSGSVIKSDQGKEFVVFDASFIDIHKRLKKFAQTIPLKDIGSIIAETGINKDSVVVEGGVGSGALSASLANIAKKVISYEVRDESEAAAKANFKRLSVSNVEVKRKSLYDGIDETGVDLVVLDVPEAHRVVNHAAKALKVGGFLVAYCPHVSQVGLFLDEVRKSDVLIHEKSVELIERLWAVDELRSRPKNSPIGHSAFLVFVRRIKL